MYAILVAMTPIHGATNGAENSRTARRSFLGRLLAGGTALTFFGVAPRRGLAEQRDAGQQAQPGEDWMRELTATHRVAFDWSAHKNGKPLSQGKNYLDAWRDSFKTSEHAVNLVFCVHGDAIPVVLADALWSRYKIGEQYEVPDAGTKASSVRNVFTAANAAAGGLVTPDESVEALQKRGARFAVCRNTVAGATKKLAAAGLGTPDEIRAAIIAGLLPGVILVPAMLVTLTQLQERGIRYLKVA
jgi:intracellular sulfur oxidation DsrE/DsrF family protein